MPKTSRDAGTETKTTASRAAKKSTKTSATSKKAAMSKKSTTKKTTNKKKSTSKKKATSKAATTDKATSTATTKATGAPIRSTAREKMSSTTPIPDHERRRLIAEAAYLRAEARGFEGGDPTVDWLEAEHEVNAHIAPAS